MKSLRRGLLTVLGTFIINPLVVLASLGATSGGYGTVVSRGDFSWEDISFIYAFGDSYTFVQGSEGLDTFRYRFRTGGS